MGLFNMWKPIPAAGARLPQNHDISASHNFPGLDPSWSRLVSTRTSDGQRTFHVLDNGPALAARGIQPTGTIFAVHGNPTWSYLWRNIIREATETAHANEAWRVIAPDQLDMGFSERLVHEEPPGPGAQGYRRLTQRLDDLDALMDVLDVDIDRKLVTLGHDWGGIISLGWAGRHEHLVDAAVSLNTAVDHPTTDKMPVALQAATATGVLSTSTIGTEGFLKVTLGLAEPRLSAQVYQAYRAPYTTRNGRGGIGGFVADIPATSNHRSRAALEKVSSGLSQWKKPLLLLWGPKDPVFQDRYLADILARVPHADLHRYEGAGHMLVEDRDITEALFTWLSQNVTSDSTQHEGNVLKPNSAPGIEPAKFEESTPELSGVQPAGPDAQPVSALHQQLKIFASSSRADDSAVVDMTNPDLGPQTLSWSQLDREVSALAQGLHELGVKPGDRISLLVQPGNRLTVILYACLRLGAVAVVADQGLGLKGMSRAVKSARPQWIIGARPGLAVARAMNWPGQKISLDVLQPRQAKALGTIASVERILRSYEGHTADSLPWPKGENDAAILFTSGSTGPAKGVRYTHRRLGALVELLREQFSIQDGASLIAGFAPFALLGPAIGATSVTPDMSVTKPSTLTAHAVAAAALASQATMFFGSPAALRNVVATSGDLTDQERLALEAIKLVLSAGAPVHPKILQEVQDLFPQAEIHTPYGMTEGLLQADISREEILEAIESNQGGVCVGKPVKNVHFALAPLNNLGIPAKDLRTPANSPHVLSEIVVSAPHLKAGYDRLWLTDFTSRRDTMDERTWHRTNDIGHFDTEGRLWIQGRLQHVLTPPTGPLGPGTVETLVDALDSVSRSAAVGVGPTGTQAVVVIVEPEGNVKDLTVHGGTPLANGEFSAQVRLACSSLDSDVASVLVVESLPTDIRHNSKIDRSALATWASRILAGEKVPSP